MALIANGFPPAIAPKLPATNDRAEVYRVSALHLDAAGSLRLIPEHAGDDDGAIAMSDKRIIPGDGDGEGGKGETQSPSRPESILFESHDKALVVIDIPRSLEEAQVLPSQAPVLRIISAEAPAVPYPTPEPRHGTADPPRASPAAQLAELMTGATVQTALQSLTSLHLGPLCLPRELEPQQAPLIPALPPHLPPNAELLNGSIEAMRDTFATTAPAFDLVVLDPPWPNRSARRRTNKYATVSNLHEMRRLLLNIPINSHLNPDGLVAVWVTNKHSIYDFLVSPSGLFAAWGLEVASEWIWLKVTTSGEPIFDIESAWRKPWEKLIIAKRIGSRLPDSLKSRVVVAVPDVHSRKPNLRGLFQDGLGENFLGLEIFARNLTAGWWCWGNEVLYFQGLEHWLSKGNP